MLMGHRDFVTVQISNENTEVQIHKPELSGDKVISSAHSTFLIKMGWKGSRKISLHLILLVILLAKKH